MMNDFQMCIFLVFPWKNNLGQPEAEMGTFLSRRSTNFSKRRAARGLGSRRSSPNSPPSPELSSGDGGKMVSFFYFPDRAQRAF